MDLVTGNGSIELDYSETGEIWITVYITPEGAPRNQATAVETNVFGTVYPSPEPLVCPDCNTAAEPGQDMCVICGMSLN